MKPQSLSRLSQVGALLFAVGFTVTACVGTDLVSSGNDSEPDTSVQTDEGLETSAPALGPATPATPPLAATANDDQVAEGPGGLSSSVESVSDEEQIEEVAVDVPEVAGRPLDNGPAAGSDLVIIGVEADDVLNFRTDPSPRAAITATRGSLDETDIVALGEAWVIESGVWWLVSVDGEEAWANQRFLSMAGNPRDVTVELVGELPTLRHDDAMAAAMAVAATQASSDPVSTITVVNEPVMSDLGGMVVVDVVGLGDDSVDGVRLWIELSMIFDETSGEEGAQDVLGVWISSVEAQPLCNRRVSDGLCV